MTLENRVEAVEGIMTETLDNVRTLVRGSPMATATAHGGGDSSLTIALCGLFLMIGLNAALIFQVNRQDTQIDRMSVKYDRMQDYLNAIYAQAPQLKPKSETDSHAEGKQ